MSRKGAELSRVTNKLIITLSEISVQNKAELSRMLNIPRTTITSVLSKYRRTGTVESLTRSAGKGASQIEMYRDVFVMMVLELDKNLWPVVVWYFEGKEYLFMDDSAPVHRAHTVENYKDQNEVTSMEWPAQSPDLNVIENIWLYMKREL